VFNQTEPQISEASNHLKHLTESEMLDVLECARKMSARDHALILVAYIYGLRNQEVARLRLTDINWDSMTITARRKKNSLTTEQPLVRHKGRPALDVVGALETWLSERHYEDSAIVFISRKFSAVRGKALSQRSVTRLWAKYCKMASEARVARGLAPIDKSVWHIHAAKHTRGTALAEKGARPQSIKMILGHKSILSTERYLHPSQKTAWQEERRLMMGAF
jgi:integrase